MTTIPGHAPRPTSSSKVTQPHDARHRDAGLERITNMTKWTLAGGLVLTGGFTVVAAAAQSIQGPASSATVTHAARSAVPPRTAPSTTTPDAIETLPSDAALPPQPADLPPVRNWSPPVVASGGS